MKKVALLAIGLMFVCMNITCAEAVKGWVVQCDISKNIAVVGTDLGYTTMELYGWANIYKGDEVIGNLHDYGACDIYNTYTNESISVYITNYMLTAEQATDWVARKYGWE